MEQSPSEQNPKSPVSQFSAYYKNGLFALQRILSPIAKSKQDDLKDANDDVCNQSTLFKFALNHTTMKMEICSCPHILIADDDSFQHLYYQSLFQKSLDFEGIFVSRENLRVQLFFSGEELLQSFQRIQKCGCKELVMIITDYQMGSGKLNGVDTCTQLRSAGYKGTLFLRTSESLKDLKYSHPNFSQLFETNIINALIEKGNLQDGKEIIQSYLKNTSRDKK